MSNRRFILTLCAFMLAPVVFGQTHAQLFKTLPPLEENTPDWARLMYSDNPNVFAVDEMFRNYYLGQVFQKNTHTQNYKHWRRQLIQNHWIDADGFIAIPAAIEQQRESARWRRSWQSLSGQRSGANWESLGPFETWDGSQWISKQVNVYTMDQSLSNPNIVFCGSETGGVYKSVDKGQQWSSVGDELDIGGVGTVKVHPLNPDTVYVGQGSNLYRSTDGGSTWTSVFFLANLNPRDLLFIPVSGANHMTILLAGQRGLFRSTDGGAGWSTISTAQSWDLELKPGSLDTVYALSTNTAAQHIRFYRSVNSGLNFTEFNSGWFAGSSSGLDNSSNGARMAVTPADPDYIYVALLGNDVSYAQDINWIGVYKSTDAGSSWTLPAGDPGGPYDAGHICPSSFHPTFAWGGNYDQGYYNLGLAVSHSDPEFFMLGCLNLWKSEDGGITYTGIGGYQPGISGYSHPDIQEIEINGTDVWVVTDGGIDLYTSDVSSKVSLNNGIDGSEYWGFDSGWNEDVLVGGRYHNGNVVLYQNYPAGKSLNLGGAESATGYVNQGINRKVYHSDIGGKLIPEAFDGSILNIGNLSMYPNQSVSNENKGDLKPDPRCFNHLYLTRDHQLWKSTTGGASFELVHTFGTNANNQAKGLEISRSNPDVIYVCQRISGAAKLWRSSDAGVSWNEVALPTAGGGGIFISLSPVDENQLYLAVSNGGTSTEKIYSTMDGGASWANLTTSTLDGHWPEQILVHGGTNGGVYLATNSTVYYRNNTHSDWQPFGHGLPVRFRSMTIRPFYKEGKVRIATYNRGIWSSDFFEPSLPIAQPTVSALQSNCSRDTLYFEDYSMLNHTGASWQWSFTPQPSWVSALTARNPKVVLGTEGSYDVTLTVTDGNGNSDTKSIADMVTLTDRCAPDSIPGKLLRTTNDGDYFVAADANLSNLTHFTVTGWWKPNGGQDGFAALFSSGDWCAHCDYTEGLIVDYFGSRLWYKWPGNAANWGSNSGMVIPLNEWSYVALVITPAGATLYLNEQKYQHNIPLSPGEIQSLYVGHGHYSHSFNGEIDEVTLWKRALTEGEIRSLRHLTKEDIVGTDPDLIAYYQFNRLVDNQVMDHGGIYHGVLNNAAQLDTSSVPAGGGVSVTQSVTAGGQVNFPGTGITVEFPATGSYPDGDIVVTRLNLAADQAADPVPFPEDRYWIINNYGTNSSFSNPDAIVFSDLPAVNDSAAIAYQLYARPSNGHGNSWTSALSSASSAGLTSLTFPGSGISTFGQLGIGTGLGCRLVSNTNDAGFGSLRHVTGCVPNGASLFFDPAIDSDTIRLTSNYLSLSKSFTVQGRGTSQTWIDGSVLSEAIHIENESAIGLRDLSIIAGQGTQGRAIQNFGALTLLNIDIYDHPVFPSIQESLLENTFGQLEIRASVRLKKNQ